MILETIKNVASSVGITTVVLNSDENIKVQLNRLTSREALPVMLISWELEKLVSFNEDGILQEPIVKVDFLLLDKASNLKDSDNFTVSESMGSLFYTFIQELRNVVFQSSRTPEQPITNISYRLQIKLDTHNHSGILGHFDIVENLDVC